MRSGSEKDRSHMTSTGAGERGWWRMKMVVSLYVTTWLLLFALGARGESRARLVNNGYEDVVVAISQEVDEADGPTIIDSLQVTVCLNPLSSQLAHPIIIRRLTFSVTGKVLLMEWAKLRWGVFDELGYPGDESFPLFYIWDENTSGVPGGGTILPTYCANTPVEGRRIDRRGRSICTLTTRGEPDENCRFLPYKDQRATSSLMSYPLIFSDMVVDFCSGPNSGHPHNPVAPTKQNLFCGGRSVWEVMLEHQDFANDAMKMVVSLYVTTWLLLFALGARGESRARLVNNGYEDVVVAISQEVDEADGPTIIDSLQQKSKSSSQGHRCFPQSFNEHLFHVFMLLEKTGVCQRASLVHRLMQITDDASRKILADSIETKADGGTSIGAGLYVAVKKILAGVKNPVILLITDGEENENPRIKDILQNVLDSGVRVITVAFGAEADPKLEKIAELTGGKTFTVNALMKGPSWKSLLWGTHFQPPPPRSNTTVTIHEEVYKGTARQFGSNFNVDFTIGKNLILRLDTNDRQHVVHPPHLVRPDGNIIGGAVFDPNTFTWILQVPLAEVSIINTAFSHLLMTRTYDWLSDQCAYLNNVYKSFKVLVNCSSHDILSLFFKGLLFKNMFNFLLIVITVVYYQMSSGTREVNATVDRVIIYAEVKQGNNPVVNANVRALVTPPNEFERDEVYILLDNGQGADIQAGDGIYSRYMTRYSATGRYSVKAQVTDGGRAVINKGFLTSSQRRRRSADPNDYEERPDYCCGSYIPLHRAGGHNTGNFTRITVAGSVKVTEIPEKDTQPPAPVRDLHIVLMDDVKTDVLSGHYNVSLSWTAPGDDLDLGIASDYVLRMTSNRSDLAEKYFNNASNETLLDLSGYSLGVEAGEEITIILKLFLVSDVTFYFALRAKDEVGGESPVSNIAVLRVEVNHHLLHQPEETPWLLLPIWAIALIISLLLLLLVFILVISASRKYGTASWSLTARQLSGVPQAVCTQFLKLQHPCTRGPGIFNQLGVHQDADMSLGQLSIGLLTESLASWTSWGGSMVLVQAADPGATCCCLQWLSAEESQAPSNICCWGIG
nr:calcium-activated chloride channel regulator 3A-1-like [Cherax quadricarinatus]